MVTKADFEAAITRITDAQGDTKVQVVALRELVLTLREEVRNGGTLSEADLNEILALINEKADEAEVINQEVQAVDDE